MRGSIPDEVFYGAQRGAPRPPRGQPSIEGRTFFTDEGDPRVGNVRALVWRLAAAPWRLALVMLVMGFLAVFVQQAPILLQIVLGAPIFEELLKFGLALLVAYPLRWLVLRLPVAAAVGAGFGWLEHAVTYPDEAVYVYAGRVAFHAATTMLSMIVFHGLARSRDVRTRWFATGPATLIHYANNTAAVLTVALLPFGERIFEAVGLAFAAAALTILVAMLITSPAWIRRYRRWAERKWRRWTRQPQVGSGGPRGPPGPGGPGGAPPGGPEANWPMRRS